MLHVQWVRRFSVSPSSFVSFLIYRYRCSSLLAVPQYMVFSYPFSFDVSSMPPVYRSLFTALLACDGSRTSSSLGIRLGIDFCPVDSIATKSTYLYLVSDGARPLHCEAKFFFPVFGLLYWPATWRQLFFFPLDRSVIDFNWKLAHGVLYTAQRLASFAYDLLTACFCAHLVESSELLGSAVVVFCFSPLS